MGNISAMDSAFLTIYLVVKFYDFDVLKQIRDIHVTETKVSQTKVYVKMISAITIDNNK